MSLRSVVSLIVLFVAGADFAIGDVVVEKCHVSLLKDLEVPAEAPGVIDTMAIKRGGEVKQGQLLAKVDDSKAQSLAKIAAIEFKSAQQQADNDIRIRYAREDALVSQAELEAMLAAKKGAFGKFEIRKAELQASSGKLGVEQATLEQKTFIHDSAASEEKLHAAKDEIVRHVINAPIDGVIVDIRRHPGEWVTIGAPVFRLVRMDRLGIDGFLNIDRDGDLVKEGMSIVATVNVGKKQVEAKGVVTYVEPIVQADGNYRVRAEVDNHKSDGRWVLRAGLPASFRVETEKPIKNQPPTTNDK